MGSVSPVALLMPSWKKWEDRIIKPTITDWTKHLLQRFFFFGLIKVKGEPMIIEYNAHGRSRNAIVMARSSIWFGWTSRYQQQQKVSSARKRNPSIHSKPFGTFSGGYRRLYKGKKINKLVCGSRQWNSPFNSFHAGTRNQDENVLDGGRSGSNRFGNSQCPWAAYSAVSQLSWEGVYFRKDIGVDLIKLAKS